MSLSPIGEIIQKYWCELPTHFPFVQLDKFIVMPNHFHGILILNSCKDEALPRLSPRPKYKGAYPQMSKISPKAKSIPVIIGSFKSICTKHARKIRPDFSWQTRYHDHIIHEEKNYNRIQDYILTNVANWKKDSENLQD
jgi:REP element-mobilizing transposase RayT